MKAILTLLLVLGLAAGIALLVLGGDDGDGWSTDSDEAAEQFEAGLAAQDKLYVNDAAEHFKAAAAADPDFLMPKVWLILTRRYDAAQRGETEQLITELRGADLDAVSEREAMLVRWLLANIDREYEAARAVVADYLEDHPDDPFAVGMECDSLWDEQDWQAARACYQRLAELAPNRVQAQNRIGYLEMSQGRFEEAEAQFEIYRYLAPDQANPHDSMGELMMLTGRYEEAERELRAAVELKPDFCASWRNLVALERMRADFERAEAVLGEARAVDGCPPQVLAMQACLVDLAREAHAGRWAEAYAVTEPCRDNGPFSGPFTFLAALAGGDPGPLEEGLADRRKDAEAEMGSNAYTNHLLALRAMARGDAAEAAGLARKADDELAYWSGDWYFKLHNRRLLVSALEADGRAEEAAELRREIDAVNPRAREVFEFPDLAASGAYAGTAD